MPQVAVVTDSSASLPADVVALLGVVVVPLQLVIGSRSYDDGVDPEASPEHVARALAQSLPVSTSRPSPEVVLAAYRAAASAGAAEIVSIHLSSEVSATHESAMLAARSAPVPVRVVDTRHVGAGTGYAVRAAAAVIAAGGSADDAAEAAIARARDTTSLFYVDTVEHLRRGGRIGAAAAFVGSALAVKPILQIQDGQIRPLEKVRTAGRALARLEELAVTAAGSHLVDVTVAHLANSGGACALAEHLGVRLTEGLAGREIEVAEVAAVLGAHVGPGLVGVTVSRRS